MNLNDGGIAYDAWVNADPAYWDGSEEAEAFELHESFDFGGLRYLLTGTYRGDNLEFAALHQLTETGLIETTWDVADFLTENGKPWNPITNNVESLCERAYAVADAALEAATEAA